MSPRKLTEDDKQEILQLYRNSEATTSTLANRYEVSSSTISRFLKNKLSTTEYEDLIQQKRLARTPRGEKNSEKKPTKPKSTKTTKAKKTRKKSDAKAKAPLDGQEIAKTDVSAVESTEIAEDAQTMETSPQSTLKRRRRRSSNTEESKASETETIETENLEVEDEVENEESDKPEKLVIDSQVEKTTADNPSEKPAKNNLILKSDKPKVIADASLEDDEDDEDDEVDLMTLKEMLGEDLEDINDEEDEEDDDDWEDDDETTAIYSKRDSNFNDLEILPLAQANFPRICYLVIDRSAELIVKPLAEFADLGEIPQDEIKQVTLPVFDNHRIAKRFSHRRERVIKVPDGRMLQKTSRHLQEKGISRLLMDGQIYSI